ncbi:uncharacterized protein [Zea mays]|jgi:hypothetical protein|uniref:Uncharacterized protein n=1 Tax=Zea mays TaxID=4577 RepID=Q5NKP4_MAIZE|nr:uncharacterized protein LOC103638131 [Zea mays]AAQ06293.1 unknown [Zea mays]AQL02298.1 hypothetical protein ZEAMMB73_Zm00001d045459 [Zea mays]|eukprot:XP_008659336.1 uncharacterized protein LOC103638131 [Zea mays]
MDKVLAFSILSASPADLSSTGAGFGGSWARLSWRRGADDQRAPRREQQQEEDEDREKRDLRSRDGGAHASGGGAAAAPPRFAPEFDGIDWFGTIVSR